MDTNRSVSAEIRAELARQQLSGTRAARQLGWTQNYISTRLRGEVPWSIPNLEAIAALLGVPVTSFFAVGSDVITTRKTFALLRGLFQARLALAA